MKPLRLVALFSFLFSPFAVLFGQGDAPKQPAFDFFAPKNVSYKLQQTGYYGQMTVFDNGQKTRTANSTSIDLKGTYWLGNGFGAGLGFEADWRGNHYTNNSDVLTRTWEVSPSLSYGTMLSDKWGVYARAGVDFGKFKNENKTPQNSTTNESDLFGYGATIGFPYRIGKYSAITPMLNYNYDQEKTDNSKLKESSFGLRVKMEDYLGCGDFKCDPGTGFKLSDGKYDRGRWFIDYETGAHYQMGTSTTSYTNPTLTFEDKFNEFDLNLEAAFYIMNYLSLGGGLSYENSVQKSDDNAFRVTNNEFKFSPEVYFHMPVDNGWRNLFVKGGGYVGSNNSEIQSNNTTTINKESFNGYNFGIGYFAFFAEETALKICTYHRSITYTDKETDDKIKHRGFRAEVGLTHFF